MTPAQIPLGYYTHINFAFSLIDPNTFQLSPMDANTGSLYGNISSLKGTQPGLQAWLSVGTYGHKKKCYAAFDEANSIWMRALIYGFYSVPRRLVLQ
jgi:hypothetical protein